MELDSFQDHNGSRRANPSVWYTTSTKEKTKTNGWKNTWQNSTSIHDENSYWMGIEGTHVNVVKTINDKPQSI